jgi:ligand-binding sensor domain-containing protein/GGDEF domain-containing protein
LSRVLITTSLLLLVCGFKVAANSLDYRYQKAFQVQSLSIEQGLSQSVVNDIIQDNDGFIWIATEDGLNRFDGYQFKIFQQDHEDPLSLHDNLIHSLLEVPGEGIWVGTQNGVTYYDAKTGKFAQQLQKNSELRTAIATMALLPSANLAIGSDNGLYIRDKQKDTISIFRADDGRIIDDEVTALEVFQEQLWVATESCIYLVSEREHTIKSYCIGELGDWLIGKRIRVIRFNLGELWIGTTHGLARVNVMSGQLQTYYAQLNNQKSLPSNWIQDIMFDPKNNLWIGTAEGLGVFRHAENEFEQHFHRAENRDGLTANDILTVFIDRSGLVWLGTYASGINILDPAETGFKQILSKSDVLPFNANNTVHGIVKDRNENLWMATYGTGLMKLNLMTGEVTRPFHEMASKINEIYGYNYSLLIDLHNRLWVGTFDGLYLIDLNSQTLLTTSVQVNNRATKFNQYIFQIYEDHSGKIWIATISGVYSVETMQIVDGQVILNLLGKNPEIPNSFRDRSSRVSCILETRDGNLWLGGTSGLLMYAKSSNKWQHFEYQPENRQSISNDDVQTIFEDSRGILWVGTANGLNKVNRESDEAVYFERITKHQGLPSNSIYGILEDNYKQLWLSTNLGLVRYSGQAESVQIFRRNDGLSSDEFNTGAYFSDSEGILYFGSINGVTAVDSRVTMERTGTRNLLFTEIKIGDREVDVYPINNGSRGFISKLKDESSIRISVADLYYQKLNTQSYRYRLLGLNDDWISLGKEKTFILAGLKAGEYILDVQARVTNEPWSDSLRLRLNVYSDFWKSDSMQYLVLTSTFALFIILVFYLRRYYAQGVIKAENMVKIESVRLKDVKKQNDELKAELDSKVRELSLIAEKLNESTQLIASFKFRDSVSGFYQYHKIRELLSQVDRLDVDSAHTFNLFVVLQLSNLSAIARKHGEIASAEVVSYVALELKKHLPANVHICACENDCFLILADSKKNTNMSSNIIQFRNRILQSQIGVSNDISVQTQIAISYLELYPESVEDSDLVINLCEILFATHRKLNHALVSGVMRLDLNKPLREFAGVEGEADIEQLIEENSLTSHFIE